MNEQARSGKGRVLIDKAYAEGRRDGAAEARLSLGQEQLEVVVHVLGCPRWQEVPAAECVYRGVHREDAKLRGATLRAALASDR